MSQDMKATTEDRAAAARGVIRLDGGRSIRLSRLHQYATYAGLLAGLPDEEMNRRRIQDASDFARETLRFIGFPRLIPPRVTVKEFPARGASEARTGHFLPGITCIGEFVSSPPARDPGMLLSSVTLVWHQDDFAPPIADDVLEEIRRLEWDAMAEDWIW